MKWKIKRDNEGKIVLNDEGFPVYIREDGSEFAANVESMYGKITSLTNEARQHREGKEAAERKLSETFGDLDPVKAREALDLVSKLDQKKLIDAGKVEEVRAEMSKQFEKQLREKDETIAKKDERYNSLVRSNAFTRSKFIAEKIAVPVDMIEATFGGMFKVEDDGNIRGYQNGNPIYSEKTPGELASFDEALEICVKNYAHKDLILKGTGGSGGGAKGGAGGAGGGRTMTRDEFSRLPPAQQAQFSKDVREGKGTLTD